MIKSKKRKRSIKFWVFILVFVIFFGLACGLLCNLFLQLKSSERILDKYVNRGLPIIEINLNEVTQEEINSGDKNIRYGGNELNIYNGGKIFEYDEIEIKGRGNATWKWDKRPYQIKFSKKTDVLGMGRAKKWYLLANYNDETNLRNEIGFSLEKMLGMEYAMDGRFVELYIDDAYQGLYYLTKAVEISDNVVDLRDPLGILVESDNAYGVREEKYFTTGNGDILTIKDVVNKDNEEVAMEDFLKSYNELEKAIEKRDYERILELADVESFAQYYLLSEFTVNPDAYWTNFYLNKDGVEDKIHAGPGWDFDMISGNRHWSNWLGDAIYSPTETMVRKLELSPEVWTEMGASEEDIRGSARLSRVIFDLMEIPEFQNEVKRLFRERMMGRGYNLVTKIIDRVGEIYWAALENNKWWDRGDFETEIKNLVKWIRIRYEYFERIYGGLQDCSLLV